MRLSTSRSAKRGGGFSFTEVLVTIGIVGIMSAIAMPVISRTDKAGRDEVANQMVTSINRAVTSYRQCGSEITTTANGSTGADESTIMLLLTTRDDGVVGSPFLQDAKWPSVESDNAQKYRVRWDGRFFVVLPPGTTGTGLLINGI